MIRFCLTLISVLTIVITSVELKADTIGVSTEADGKWIINHPDSRRIYAVQCGLDVTLFTLKYFKVDYSLPLVSLGLPLSMDGISLADIQQMLQVYGLEADARKGATIKQIAARLNGEYIAGIYAGFRPSQLSARN